MDSHFHGSGKLVLHPAFFVDQTNYLLRLQLMDRISLPKGKAKMSAKCDQCPYTSCSSSDIRRQIIWTHSDQRPWKCLFQECALWFKTEYALIRHKRKHEASLELRRPHPCNHDNCNYRAGSTGSLKLHVWTKHTAGRTRDIKCPICPKIFCSQLSIKEHIRTHTREKQYGCDQCNFKTHCHRSISIHGKTVHEGTKDHKCTFSGCSFSAARHSNLGNHLRTHSTDPKVQRPFPCRFPNCTYRTSSKGNLTSHVTARHDPSRTREYSCPLCPKSFYDKTNMRAHINTAHTREKVKKRFKCTTAYCKYKTNYQPSFRSHLLTHEDDPEKRYPFPCSFPGCDFRRRGTYEIKHHEQKHQNSNRQLKCKLCPSRSYSDKNSLSFHEKIAHARESHQRPMCSFSELTRMLFDEHTSECHQGDISSGQHGLARMRAASQRERKSEDTVNTCGKTVGSAFCCRGCSFKGSDRKLLRQHSMVHRVAVVRIQAVRLEIM